MMLRMTMSTLLAAIFLSSADDLIYDSPYGGEKAGRIEDNGKLYDKPSGGEAVGRYEDGKVYDNPYGGKVIGSTDSKDGAGYFLLKEKSPECKEK